MNTQPLLYESRHAEKKAGLNDVMERFCSYAQNVNLKFYGMVQVHVFELNKKQSLLDALEELDGVVAYAKEEDFEVPTLPTIDHTRRFLQWLYTFVAPACHVYPMPTGSIAIDVANGRGSSVLFLCDTNGRVSCLVNIQGQAHRHESSSLTNPLPLTFRRFIQDALQDLHAIRD